MTVEVVGLMTQSNKWLVVWEWESKFPVHGLEMRLYLHCSLQWFHAYWLVTGDASET